eukprot:GHVS01058107.1.p2 GENE.GHVS01058107.1~~GHVS01058107.1.p2  ORF type:complete len:115 (-),score=22.32 GHVS01058107.1:45-389(-)
MGAKTCLIYVSDHIQLHHEEVCVSFGFQRWRQTDCHDNEEHPTATDEADSFVLHRFDYKQRNANRRLCVDVPTTELCVHIPTTHEPDIKSLLSASVSNTIPYHHLYEVFSHTSC